MPVRPAQARRFRAAPVSYRVGHTYTADTTKRPGAGPGHIRNASCASLESLWQRLGIDVGKATELCLHYVRVAPATADDTAVETLPPGTPPS